VVEDINAIIAVLGLVGWIARVERWIGASESGRRAEGGAGPSGLGGTLRFSGPARWPQTIPSRTELLTRLESLTGHLDAAG
jgi:hypothetical protein